MRALLTASVVLLWFNGKSRWLSVCDCIVVTHASVGLNCGSAGLGCCGDLRDVDGGVREGEGEVSQQEGR